MDDLGWLHGLNDSVFFKRVWFVFRSPKKPNHWCRPKFVLKYRKLLSLFVPHTNGRNMLKIDMTFLTLFVVLWLGPFSLALCALRSRLGGDGFRFRDAPFRSFLCPRPHCGLQTRLCLARLAIAQSPYRVPEPRNPKSAF